MEALRENIPKILVKKNWKADETVYNGGGVRK